MREVGVAARPVQGYRSGARDPIRLTETVRNSDSHAWVEVYFPGYGWVTFDPTGGSIGSDVNVELIEGVEQSGSPGASASAIARPSGIGAGRQRAAARAAHHADRQHRGAAHRHAPSCWRRRSGCSPSWPGGADHAAP